MDELDGVPIKVLGYQVKTRTQIILSCLLPAILEVFVYIVLMTADTALTVLHYMDGHLLWGTLTLIFIWLPAIICFASVMASPWHWPEETGCNTDNTLFLLRQCFNLLLFPIGAFNRFSRRIFWSIESLFHDRESYERHQAVSKAAETSPFELYHFLQAFFQAAPQIILQLFILLRENIFRDYETTTAQVVSIVFSLIKMAMTIMSFQRFESQKVVGRNYPWDTIENIQERRNILKCTTSMPVVTSLPASPIIDYQNINYKRSSSQINNDNYDETDAEDNVKILTTPNVEVRTNQFGSPTTTRKTLNVDPSNFNNKTSDDKCKTTKVDIANITDDEKLTDNNGNNENSQCNNEKKMIEKNIFFATSPQLSTASSNVNNVTDEDLIEYADIVPEDDLRHTSQIKLRLNDETTSMRSSYEYDRVPDAPPPPTPESKFSFKPLQRLSTIKDMLIYNAESYIKENVPRLPKGAFEHHHQHHHHPQYQQHEQHQSQEEKSDHNQSRASFVLRKITEEDNTSDVADDKDVLKATRSLSADGVPPDEVDLILPTRKRFVAGIEQDDIVGKTVAFLGWAMFLLMRMISLSVFSVFHPLPCAYLCFAHYVIMLLCLLYETKFHDKIERLFFYIFLAYVYIFCILEFKIKFIHIKIWYIGYIIVVFLQNIIITILWHSFSEYNSWWFQYLFFVIIFSGVLSIMCLLFYYFLLKPKDKVLFRNE